MVGARNGRNPQKVLFIHCQSEIGGAETLLLSTLKYLNRERYHPFVFCFGRDDDPLPARLRELGVDHQLIVPHRLRQLGKTIRTLQRLIWFVHKENVAVVIAYSLFPYIYARLLAALTRTKSICYVMDMVAPKWWRNGFVKALPMVIGHRSLLADSNYVRENLKKAFPWIKSVKTVYHGIDQSCFDPALYNAAEVRLKLGIPEEAPVLAIVGRLQTWKGQHVFIQAARLVHKTHPHAKFLIVGGTINRIDPGYEESLYSLVKELDLNGIVLFLGHRDDVPAIMSASDIIVHASIEPEPFGCVIIEGMAMKKPIIATNIGGPTEIIVNGETGLLIPPSDPRAMAGAIQKLLYAPELCMRMGDKGRRRVEEHFTADRMTHEIEAEIEASLKP